MKGKKIRTRKTLGRPRSIPRPIILHPTDPSLALVQLTKGYYATISVVDTAEVGKFCWCIGPDARYAIRAAPRSEGKRITVYLHCFIADLMGLRRSDEVDHENGNGLDCRRSNLRDATRTQNARNARLGRNSSTGIKGVSFHRSRPSSKGSYIARLMVDRQALFLGSFASAEEAGKAVAEARERLHGEFANHGSN